nr:hypothetical protein [Tanacetum cinerariifolium]
CNTLQNKVLDLEKTKTTNHNEIASLKRRVKKLEKKNRSRTHKLKRLYKVKWIVFQEPSKSPTTTTTISSQQSQDKGKGIIIEEPVKPTKKDQIMLDEEAALKLQAEFDEEERLAREKAKKEQEANIALIET